MNATGLINKKTAVGVLILLGAILAISPAGTRTTSTYSMEELAEVISGKSNYITAEEVAEWLIDKRPDFLLVDIRPEDEYAQYHIPGAVNIPFENLFGPESMDILDTDSDIILYSNGTTNAAQAWLMLKESNIENYILQGGMNYWAKAVLNPTPPDDIVADSEILAYQFRSAASGFFTGGAAIEVQGNSTEKTKKPVVRKPRKKSKKKKGGSCY